MKTSNLKVAETEIEKESAFFKEEGASIRKKLIDQLQELSADSKETLDTMNTDAGNAEVIDLANVETSRLLNLRFRDRDRKLINKIYNALRRLNEQQYHLCENCGGLIGKVRLLAKPTASLCIKCQKELEQDKFVRQL